MITTYINKPDILKWYIYKILLIMRLTTAILMVSMLQVNASTVAQEFTYVKKGVSLIQIFEEVKKQTGYNIIWNEKKIDVTPTIDASFKKAAIQDVLNKCLSNLPLSYSITITTSTTAIDGQCRIALLDGMRIRRNAASTLSYGTSLNVDRGERRMKVFGGSLL